MRDASKRRKRGAWRCETRARGGSGEQGDASKEVRLEGSKSGSSSLLSRLRAFALPLLQRIPERESHFAQFDQLGQDRGRALDQDTTAMEDKKHTGHFENGSPCDIQEVCEVDIRNASGSLRHVVGHTEHRSPELFGKTILLALFQRIRDVKNRHRYVNSTLPDLHVFEPKMIMAQKCGMGWEWRGER